MSHGKKTKYAPKALKIAKTVKSKQPHALAEWESTVGITVSADAWTPGFDYYWLNIPDTAGDPSTVFPLATQYATLSYTVSGNVVTITVDGRYDFFADQTIIVSGMTDGALNGTFEISGSSAADQISYALVHGDIPATADTGGSVAFSSDRGNVYGDFVGAATGAPFNVEAQVRYGKYKGGTYSLRVEGCGVREVCTSTSIGLVVELDPYAFSDISWWTCAVCGLPERKASLIRHPSTGKLVHAHDYDEPGVVELQTEGSYREQAAQHTADLYKTLGEWP